MNHCDYATAHNIYVCLGFSSIIRMKETILVSHVLTALQPVHDHLEGVICFQGSIQKTCRLL